VSRPTITLSTITPPVASRRYRRVLFDSSVWIAFYLETDLFHYEALRLVGSYEKKRYQMVVPLTVLIELIVVLSRKGVAAGRIEKIVDYIRRTENHLIHLIGQEEMLKLAVKFSEITKLKSQDYIIFLHYVKLVPVQFESFDRHLLSAIKHHEKHN
jgi:predicted nucleic acid-binding protein